MFFINQIVDNVQVNPLRDVVIGFKEIEIYVNLKGQIIDNEDKDDKNIKEEDDEDVQENNDYTEDND